MPLNFNDEPPERTVGRRKTDKELEQLEERRRESGFTYTDITAKIIGDSTSFKLAALLPTKMLWFDDWGAQDLGIGLAKADELKIGLAKADETLTVYMTDGCRCENCKPDE